MAASLSGLRVASRTFFVTPRETSEPITSFASRPLAPEITITKPLPPVTDQLSKLCERRSTVDTVLRAPLMPSLFGRFVVAGFRYTPDNVSITKMYQVTVGDGFPRNLAGPAAHWSLACHRKEEAA